MKDVTQKKQAFLACSSLPPEYAGAGNFWYYFGEKLYEKEELSKIVATQAAKADRLFKDFQETLPPKKVIREKVAFTKVKYSLFKLKIFLRLGWIIASKRNEICIIFITGTGPVPLLAAYWAIIYQIPFVYRPSCSGVDDLKSLQETRKNYYSLYCRASLIWAISSDLRKKCLLSGFAPQRVLLPPIPARSEKFRPAGPLEKSEIRERMEIPINAKVLIFVGAVGPRKGAHFIPEIYFRTSSCIENIYFLIIGPHLGNLMPNSGEKIEVFLRERLQDEIRRGVVRIEGARGTVHEYLKAADVFILPTRNEGMPNALVEAISCGIPALVTKMEGVTEAIIENGVNGYEVTERSAEAFANAAIKCLRDRGLRPRSQWSLGKKSCEKRDSLHDPLSLDYWKNALDKAERKDDVSY